MKKLFFIIMIIGIIGGISWWKFMTPIGPLTPLVDSEIPSETPTPATKHPSIRYGDREYSYGITIASPPMVTLFPNYAERRSSQIVMEANQCKQAISGGFYDTNNAPLGLFHANGTTLAPAKANALFNGFFSIDEKQLPIISDAVPEHSRIALQTGPLLFFDEAPLPLRIKNDEHARRMAVAITTDRRIVFLSVFSEEGVFDGPLLGDLPAVIESIGQKESLTIISAINLDGGSASAFYNEQTRLAELTPIGSLFCIK
jgi:uncharacterized protein YigE (DUF2233 family)